MRRVAPLMRSGGDKTLREPDVVPVVTVRVSGDSYLVGMAEDWDIMLISIEMSAS